MKIVTGALCALSLVVGLAGMSACSDAAEPNSTPSTAPSVSAAPTSGPSKPAAGEAPTASSGESSAAPTAGGTATTANQPVPKVQRSDAPNEPTSTAKPARVDQTVAYSDGVALQIDSVRFDKETKKGPGSFPGREYAVFSLKITNKSSKDLSMSTVVVTVLDKNGQQVAPVYTDEAKVQDFSGTVKKGKSATAQYAFAVAKSSRSKVTIVVDFDGVHTSAVFRGNLNQ